MPSVLGPATWMTPEDIETKAEALLNCYREHAGEDVGFPVPVQQIIEGYLDLSLEWAAVADEPDSLVLAYLDPRTKKILVNETHLDFFGQYCGSEAFTLAHEIGHWVLHVRTTEFVQLGLLPGLTPQPFVCRATRGGKPDGREWQADVFAAALLMPRGAIRSYVSTADICSWPTLYALRDRFGVTISALRNRLVSMNMLYVSDDGKLFANREAYDGQIRLS